ncbi:MAG TPA: ATP-binding protein [Magnetospirillum sp.]|nr:ATP-binding protein [Magnetospirillum sp.]
MNSPAIPQPQCLSVHQRLLERSGRSAWLVDGDGVVLWANSRARRALPALSVAGAGLCDQVAGFTPGGTADLDMGTLVCEPVEGGWAVFLEPEDEHFISAHVLDLIPVPVFWKDLHGVYRGCNLAFSELLGLPVNQIVGKSVEELNCPDMAAKYREMDQQLLESGVGGIQRYEWDALSRGGQIRRSLFHKACLDDGYGNVIGLVGMVMDITDLRRLERKFATVFKACPDPVTITEWSTGRYIDVNDAYFTTTGFTREEALGRTSVELGIWVDAEERQALLAALQAEGRLTNFETRFRRKDGSIFTALVAVEVTELDNVKCLILIAHDISDRKHEEVLLRRTAEELHRSNLELERFAYVAAHDLQEPCRTICSFAQLLERRYGDVLGDEGQEYLGYLSNGAQRMRQLIQGLLRYSRVGTNALRFETVDLNDVVESALTDLAGAIEQASAHIKVGELPCVRGDAVQLRQVVANLVGNALKFQPPGQRPVVELNARRQDDGWQISVADNGIGIEAEYADHVFGMFRRLHGGSAYPGTGIGLAVVKRVMEAHGGRVWVESEPGKGSIFQLTLPA